MRNARRFLELCTEKFPSPRPSQSHSLIFRDGKFILTLMQGNTWQSFNLDESDLDRAPESLIEDLNKLLNETLVEEKPPIVPVPPPSVPNETA